MQINEGNDNNYSNNIDENNKNNSGDKNNISDTNNKSKICWYDHNNSDKIMKIIYIHVSIDNNGAYSIHNNISLTREINEIKDLF